MEIQFRDAETFRLTLWGIRNHHDLHLQPPEEEEEEEDKSWNMEDAGGELKAFYSCWPAPVSPESTTQSHCLLWLSNQTALRGLSNQPPPAEKGRCWRQEWEEDRSSRWVSIRHICFALQHFSIWRFSRFSTKTETVSVPLKTSRRGTSPAAVLRDSRRSDFPPSCSRFPFFLPSQLLSVQVMSAIPGGTPPLLAILL